MRAGSHTRSGCCTPCGRASARPLHRKLRASAPSPAIIHAPPVPCRLTGVPDWEATAPSSATAAPDPRATASARRRSSNSAWPALRSRDSTSCTAPIGRPAACQRGSQRVLDDRPRRAERIGPDAEHDGVAAAHDTARVGEHVGPALEHEADDAERRPPHLHRPAVVVDLVRSNRPAPTPRRARPAGPATMSLRIESLSRDGSSTGPQQQRPRHRRRSPRRSAANVDVVGDQPGELVEERRDRVVVAAGQLRERIGCRRHGAVDDRAHRRRNVEQRTGRLHDHETIPGAKVAASSRGTTVKRSPPKNTRSPSVRPDNRPSVTDIDAGPPVRNRPSSARMST